MIFQAIFTPTNKITRPIIPEKPDWSSRNGDARPRNNRPPTTDPRPGRVVGGVRGAADACDAFGSADAAEDSCAGAADVPEEE